MNKKKISLFIISTSIIGGINFTDKPVYAVETSNNTPNVKSSVKIKTSKGEVINVRTSLNIRESATTNSSILGHLIQGQQFSIKSKDGDWYNIDFNGQIGYVHKNFVKELNGDTSSNPLETKPTPFEKPNETTSSNGEVINVRTSLRMRSDASINSNIVGSLKNGDKLSIKGKYGDWYSIDFNGKVVYVHKDFVKETEYSVPDQIKPSKGNVTNIITNLRMRKYPSTNSPVISYLINGQEFNVNGKTGDWYFIEHDNKVGYIHKDYAKVLGNHVPDVNPANLDENLGMGIIYNVSTNLRLRSKPSLSADSEVLAYILSNETCNIIGISGEWYKVKYAGKTGYLNKNYVKMIDSSEVKDPAGHSNVYNIVFNAMKSHIGSPYVWGGSGELLTTTSLNSLILRFPNDARSGKYNIPSKYIDTGYRSFDCSGLMQWGFKQANINIGRTTWDQITNGIEVSKDNIKPGDLLFFSDLNHVGMYVGDGKWIESPNTRNLIRIVDVPWYKIGRIRRLI